MTALANVSNLAHNEKPATVSAVTGLYLTKRGAWACNRMGFVAVPHFAQPKARSKRAVSMAESLSPSAWHDWRESSPAHDEMQLRVFRDLVAKQKAAEKDGEVNHLKGERRRTHGWEHSYNSVPMKCVGVYAEFPLRARNRVIAFADIARIWEDSEGYSSLHLIELKPKLLSVGAVLRQCHALNEAAQASGRECVWITIVVYSDDPKLPMLKELSPFGVVPIEPGNNQ